MPDEVLFHMASDHEVDERQILQNIIVAEERFIANALCDKFYEDLIAAKNRKVTEENRTGLLVLINAQQEVRGRCQLTDEDLPIGTIINAIEFVEDTDYVELWDRFLWKLTAECVDYMTIVPSWLRHTSSGQMMNNPRVIGGSGSASGDPKDIQFKMNSFLQDRIDPLLERMRLWICEHKDLYPLYCKDCGDCLPCSSSSDEKPDGVSHLRKTDFIMNIYDDDDC
jgi:hypothetical protein